MKLIIAIAALAGCVDAPETSETDDALTYNTTTFITSAVSGKCMDIWNGSTSQGAVVQQYGCHYGPDQQFLLQPYLYPIVQLVNVHSHLCVTATQYAGYGTTSMPLVQTNCGATYGNLWTLDDVATGAAGTTAVLRWAYDSAFCIDLPGGSLADGQQLQAYRCNYGLNQTWHITQ